VEDDIKPFRDVLLGLFFVTVGMRLQLGVLVAEWPWVVALLAVVVIGKAAIITGLSRLFGSDPGVALRTGLALAGRRRVRTGAAGAGRAAPVCAGADAADRVGGAGAVDDDFALPHRAQRASGPAFQRRRVDEPRHGAARNRHPRHGHGPPHVIICGYGRSGQNLARFLEQEQVSFIALDYDPQRVREAAAAGESVVFGDAARREVLVAGPVARECAGDLVCEHRFGAEDSGAGAGAATRAGAGGAYAGRQRHRPPQGSGRSRGGGGDPGGQPDACDPGADATRRAAQSRARRICQTREQRYGLFRGFYRGVTDEVGADGDKVQPRLRSVVLPPGSAAVGKTLKELDLPRLNVEVNAIRRRNIRSSTPDPETRLTEGDVVVLRGRQEGLEAVDMYLMQG